MNEEEISAAVYAIVSVRHHYQQEVNKEKLKAIKKRIDEMKYRRELEAIELEFSAVH
ncbi:hypothetical protein [Vibrio sp. F13]|uniref:hypothetical protein n=1 Tax=Vibrio sp. F13 TaxID=2070777 RepID=UPI0014851C52|nr:hypothetical protein [Vibrio sp. F13]